MSKKLTINFQKDELLLNFVGELTLYDIASFEKNLYKSPLKNYKKITIDLESVQSIDTAVAILIDKTILENMQLGKETTLLCQNNNILSTLELIKTQRIKSKPLQILQKEPLLDSIGKVFYNYYIGFISFMEFLGELFLTNFHFLKSIKNIRYKEIAFEINESAIKALGIISLTSFLIGLVVAYQSSYQLKIYGANIFIVDMLGISILRELAPLITAIVIAGRSGSAFTAQIGAMKITQELDAMRTMGFNPFIFLVVPRILALMIMMPILIFVSDIMGILGGMMVANLDLNITVDLFLDRFNDVVAAKHFFLGISKGPFFAFLIASIGIYRGLMVKDDTQSIGFNTTKSVVESIFAVIICDAIFSIVFTNLGI
jgi:phospholipid/cholesterol/gamma-HCH transport system permease protein